jgi:putative oxidoreductase
MIKKLMKTTNDHAVAVVRMTLSLVMFAHGSQKMLGWFGGHGPTWTVEMWSKWFGFPAFITWAVIIGEFVAPLFLLAGFFTRIMTLVITMIMFGAIYFVHARWGFYMNWYNQQDRGEGIEYHILVLAICFLLIKKGSGAWSIDKMLSDG